VSNFKRIATAIGISLVLTVAGIGIGTAKGFSAEKSASTEAVSLQSESYYVEDGAGVLSKDTIRDVYQWNKELSAENAAALVVVTTDDLDGASIVDEANRWYEEKELNDRSFLLLLSTGDEDYYTVYRGDDLVEYLGYGSNDYDYIQYLIGNYLEPDFADGKYDEAVQEFGEQISLSMDVALEPVVENDVMAEYGMFSLSLITLAVVAIVTYFRRKSRRTKMGYVQTPPPYQTGYTPPPPRYTTATPPPPRYTAPPPPPPPPRPGMRRPPFGGSWNRPFYGPHPGGFGRPMGRPPFGGSHPMGGAGHTSSGSGRPVSGASSSHRPGSGFGRPSSASSRPSSGAGRSSSGSSRPAGGAGRPGKAGRPSGGAGRRR
jgi:uncharacterized membrane protein YgcG